MIGDVLPFTRPATFTPPGLTFDEPTHTYRLDGRRLLNVTGVLRGVGLDGDAAAWWTPEARVRGRRVHAAIARTAWAGPIVGTGPDPELDPYLAAFERFLADSAFRIDAAEERLADPLLGVAGTLDLRGEFVGPVLGERPARIDVVDVKTGAPPPSVGYQTAAYVRLLPPGARARARRWCLCLPGDDTYKLIPLLNRSDEPIFLAAALIARAKQGEQ